MNKHQILKSYQLLQDCKRAIRYHTDDLQTEDFRVSWVAVIAMLRAIGHVLKNVDSEKSDVHKQVIADWWERLNARKP